MVGMDLEGGRYFFNAVRGDGDSILYACDDENECSIWVMAMYRATGQSLKPTPPLTHDKNSTISKIQGDADKARKHGMEDFISADPCTFDHHNLFRILQNLTLEYRLNDPYASLVSSLAEFWSLLCRGRFQRQFQRQHFSSLNEDKWKWLMWATFSTNCNHFRVGIVPVKYSCWTSTVHDTGRVVVIVIYAIYPICWTRPKRIAWSIRR